MEERGAAEAGRLRRAMLWLVLLGIAGLSGELYLLEHTESFQQWIPFAALAAGLAGTLLCLARPTRPALRLFQGAMALLVLTGVTGVLLHYQGNTAFEREMDPGIGGVELFWEAARGATPALAPGALVQLGLLGLLFTFRHPALRAATPSVEER